MQTRNRGAHGQPNAAVRSARKRRFSDLLFAFVSRRAHEDELGTIRGDRRLSGRDTRDGLGIVTFRVTVVTQLAAPPTLAFRGSGVLGVRRAADNRGANRDQGKRQASNFDDPADDQFRILGKEDNALVIFRIRDLLPHNNVAAKVFIDGDRSLRRDDSIAVIPIIIIAHERPHIVTTLERSSSFRYAELAAAQVPKKAGASRFALGGRFLLSGGSGSGMATANSCLVGS